ncbi:MAG TPA: hypothetical protein VFU21_04620 [Kofleriaceae bacterium]|nr:hypothetical protein [Kofleriaceae bacterium]
MTRTLLPALLLLVPAAACGGGDGDGGGEPLLAGSMAGEYDGNSFTPANGFATVYQGANLIGVGDGPIRCDSVDDDDPPSGTNAAFAVPAFEAGTYANVLVQLYRNVDGFEGVGSNQGSVTLEEATDTSVAGSVEYDYTDDDGRHFAISGTFEVVRCAP